MTRGCGKKKSGEKVGKIRGGSEQAISIPLNCELSEQFFEVK